MNNNPFYEKNRPTVIKSGGNLPHWYQPGKIIYITFRLADSLPQTVITWLRKSVDKFMLDNPKPWDYATAARYRELVSPTIESLLDKGYGECVLKSPEIRDIVVSALNFNAADNYDIIAYVIMPNHVHLLLAFYPETTSESIIKSIKGYTATLINRRLQRKGTLWKSEYFDHIVRNNTYLRNYITYIANNPASLPPDTFTLYINPAYNR